MVDGERLGWGTEFNDLIEIAERFELAEISHDVVRLRDATSRSSYRVTVLGAFSSGKSTLINNLLGFPLLRVRAVPTTDRVTLITAGQRDRAGHVTMREPSDVSAVIERVVPVESSWLRVTSLELVDTPGLDIGDGFIGSPAPAEAVALTGDTTVLVVRAIGGFDRHEQELLGVLASMRRQDTPLVVVTMLNGIDDELVMRRMTGLARSVDAAIEVFEGPGSDPAGSDFARRVEALRSRLSSLARARREATRRQRPTGELLLHICRDLEDVATEGLRAAEVENAQRAVVLERIRAQRGASRALWAMLKTELEPRADELVARISEETRQLGRDLAEKYVRAIAESPTPAARWDDISGQINDRFTEHDADMGRLLHTSFAETAQWMDERLAARAARDEDSLDELAEGDREGTGPLGNAPAPARPNAVLSAATVELIAEAVTDSVRTVTTTGLALAAPAIPIAGALGGLLGRGATQLLRSRVQRAESRSISEALHHFLDAWVDAITNGAAERTAKLFIRLVEAGEQRHDTWWHARERAWDDSVPIDRWTALRSEASRMERQITERLRETHD